MFIIMTIEAEKFPVAAVGGVVIVIVIFVMNCQFADFFSGKLAAASAAYMREKLQRLFPITLFAQFPRTPGFRYNPVFSFRFSLLVPLFHYAIRMHPIRE